MLLPVLGVVVGLALLTVSADQFVVGATRIAARLAISTIVIGAVVIGFGTSAPELVVSTLAAAQDALPLAGGNLVGSNIANLTLVLGVAALIHPVTVDTPVLRREAPLSLAATLLLAVLLWGGTLTILDGLLLASALVVALWIILRTARAPSQSTVAGTDQLGAFLSSGGLISLPRAAVRTGLGLLGTLASAQLLVVSASEVARGFGLSEAFIGLTVVAIGTSLPELATAVQAARRKETDLMIGNLLGSNLFNSGAVGAAAAFAGAGDSVGATVSGPGALLMAGVAVVASTAMLTGHLVRRWEGLMLLAIYLAALPLLA